MGTITVSHLVKAYKQYPSRWVPLAEWLVLFCPKRHTPKWILQEINLPDQPGAAAGINGTGKSTSLKMIICTTQTIY